MVQLPCEVLVWHFTRDLDDNRRRRGNRVVCGLLRLQKCTAQDPGSDAGYIPLWRNVAQAIGQEEE